MGRRHKNRPHCGSGLASNKATLNNDKPMAYRLIQADSFGKIRSNDLSRVSRLGENEHHTENPRVGGSIPPLGTIYQKYSPIVRYIANHSMSKSGLDYL